MIQVFKFISLTIAPVVARLICSICFKQKTTGKDYAFIFVMSFILVLFYTCTLDGAPPKNKFSKSFVLTKSQSKEYTKKRDNCAYWGTVYYENAKDRCWWMPSYDFRSIGRSLFNASSGTFASLLTRDPRAQIIGTLISTLTYYGFECLNEWDYIQTELLKSQQQWELYDFYTEVLEKA